MKLIIATRKSPLALWQTNYIANLLREKTPEVTVEIRKIITKGDKISHLPLPQIGDKGLFTQALEDELLSGDVHLAVHSLKDLPSKLPEGLIYAGSPKRANPTDAFISHKWKSLQEVPKNAVIATGSMRRKALLQGLLPDATFPDLRGNIETRLQKLKDNDWDGIIMASAALERLEQHQIISEHLDPKIFIPAVAQGAIGIEIREDRRDVLQIIEKINDTETVLCVTAERAFLKTLEGGCSIPIGAFATMQQDILTLQGFVSSVDGKKQMKQAISGSPDQCEFLGIELAQKFIENGALEVIRS